MRTAFILALAFLSLLPVGCNKNLSNQGNTVAVAPVSEGFKREGSYVYFLLEKPYDTLKNDVTVGLAHAKAAAGTQPDKDTVQTLETYADILKYGKTWLDYRLAAVCKTEAAKRLAIQQPIDLPANPPLGACNLNLRKIQLQSQTEIVKCLAAAVNDPAILGKVKAEEVSDICVKRFLIANVTPPYLFSSDEISKFKTDVQNMDSEVAKRHADMGAAERKAQIAAARRVQEKAEEEESDLRKAYEWRFAACAKDAGKPMRARSEYGWTDEQCSQLRVEACERYKGKPAREVPAGLKCN